MRLDRLFKLQCGVQHYFWGGKKRGGRLPYIAELMGLREVADEPYAELWIGTHPRNPSRVCPDGQDTGLGQFIAEHPREILGAGLMDRGVDALPFLLKVLDCEVPLSIQAHPDRSLAATLHERDPEHYPDSNHKPEIAVAITPFTGLCQFRERGRILQDLDRIAALGRGLDSASTGRERPDWLRRVYRELFAKSAEHVAALVRAVAEEVGALPAQTPEDECFLGLQEQFPGDRGTLSAYFLNLLRLAPGEAVFLAACEPHAYLHGTIVECMANSDNVVRAGLTPKFIDREVLLDMLTYREGRPRVWSGEVTAPGTRVYRVPAPEFRLAVWCGDRHEVRNERSNDAVSLLLVLNGAARFTAPDGRTVSAPRGSAWLWPAVAGKLETTFLAPGTQIVRATPGE